MIWSRRLDTASLCRSTPHRLVRVAAEPGYPGQVGDDDEPVYGWPGRSRHDLGPQWIDQGRGSSDERSWNRSLEGHITVIRNECSSTTMSTAGYSGNRTARVTGSPISRW